MILTTIGLIGQLPNGTHLEQINAKITAIRDPKSGESTYGPWSMQNVELIDATGKITAVLKNQPPLATGWQGFTATWTATKDGKGKLAGIVVDDNDYKGTVTRRLLIHPEAIMEQAPDAGPTQAQQQYQQQAPAPQQYASPKQVPQQQAQSQAQPPAAQPRQPQARAIGIHGATVGMAINNAVHICRDLFKDDPHAFTGEHFPKSLWLIASDIVRVSQRMESGHLASSPAERIAKGQAAAQQAQPQQQPQPQAPSEDFDAAMPPDDIPF